MKTPVYHRLRSCGTKLSAQDDMWLKTREPAQSVIGDMHVELFVETMWVFPRSSERQRLLGFDVEAVTFCSPRSVCFHGNRDQYAKITQPTAEGSKQWCSIRGYEVCEQRGVGGGHGRAYPDCTADVRSGRRPRGFGELEQSEAIRETSSRV